MLLIYTIKVTPRLQYIADLLLRELLEIDFEFTNSADRFYQYSGPKINYSKERSGNELFIYSHPLLFETDIKLQRTEYGEYNGIPTLFSSGKEADLPYDPFAAAFFLVSRYEEYLPFKEDKHGRFRFEKGVAYHKGFHQIPVVNHYALHLKDLIHSHYPEIIFSSKEYQFILTYDIDQAYKYSELPWYRSIGGRLKAILRRDWNHLKERKKVLSGEEKDPFDTFDEQFRISQKNHLYPIYFFLLGNYSSLDKNNSWNSKRMNQLIKNIADKYLIGIHPSFKSFKNSNKLENEVARLNSVSGKKIIRSRQHFLFLEFPYTYRNLIAQGIEEDYTMGNPNIIGFRASIASPFYFYDLKRDETTSLRVHPFAAMDSTLFYYTKVTAESALEELKLITDEIKKVHGTFIYIAHNDLISKQSLWKGWSQCFEEFIEYAKE
ncbi:MAG: polysaccharide deacetylase family protein [Bacteroidota bacterium]